MSYPKTFGLVSLGLASSAAGYACLVSSLCKLNLQGGVGAQLAGKTFGALNPCYHSVNIKDPNKTKRQLHETA